MKLPSTSDGFNQFFSAWLRIEPRSRSDDLEDGVRARIADPLWMLARQWQTGEFQAEDAGSPIRSELHYSTQTIDRISLGSGPSEELPKTPPLEAVVEREADQMDCRESVRVGQEYERRLRALLVSRGSEAEGRFGRFVAALRVRAEFPGDMIECPIDDLDQTTRSFVRLMQGRVINGKTVLEGPLNRPRGAPVSKADLEKLHDEIDKWHQLVCQRPSSKQPPAWRSEQLDYRFELNGKPDQTVGSSLPTPTQKIQLVAPEYRNGDLDWYTFSVGEQGGRGPWNPAPKPLVTTPTQLDISGTSPRWWAFEDGFTNFGALDVAKPDLAKLMLMEFVLIYGDDWFSVPTTVALGNAVKVDRLTIRNVFGENVDIKPARKVSGDANQRFELFSLSPVNAPGDPGLAIAPSYARRTRTIPDARPVLFVPPLVAGRIESPPIEEVSFLRDEGANMLWAIETLIPDGLGRPVSGFDAQLEYIQRLRQHRETELTSALQLLHFGRLEGTDRADLEADIAALEQEIQDLTPYASPKPVQGAAPQYRLASSVDQNWIPFIPSRRGVETGLRQTAMQFRRATMLRNADELSPDPVASMSRLLALNEQALLWINEEAVPRAGLRVQLTRQRARDSNGETYVWLGRKVLAGKGEGASGLKFDEVANPGSSK